MMAKPIRALELRYPMIQFLIIIIIRYCYNCICSFRCLGVQVFRRIPFWLLRHLVQASFSRGSLSYESSFVHDKIIHGQLKNNDKNKTKVTKNQWWKSLFGVIDFTFWKIESEKSFRFIVDFYLPMYWDTITYKVIPRKSNSFLYI